MLEATTTTIDFPSAATQDVVTEILRQGAQRLLATAVEAEVAEYIDAREHIVTEGDQGVELNCCQLNQLLNGLDLRNGRRRRRYRRIG